MKKSVFYSKFWLVLALFVFIVSVSGTISPVSGQFGFGDDSEESSDESDSGDDSSDEGGFSFGDDEDESSESSESSEKSDSDGGFGFDDDSDSASDDEKTETETENEEVEGTELDDKMEPDDQVTDDETKAAENADGKPQKSRAKASVVKFASNGSRAGEEAKLVLHGVEYRFRWCPAGSFLMGSPMKEKGRKLNEKQMEVVVPHGFWMLETEVTMQMFASFVRETGYKTDAERDSTGAYHVDVASGQILGPEPGFSWKKTGFHLEKDFPVTNVTWYDAQKFVEWLNAEISTHEDPLDSKRQVRLPSEMQWEYACRAGNPGMYGCGDKMENLVNHANLREINQNVTIVKTDLNKFTPWSLPVRQEFRYSAPVAGRTPNAWGLFDLHGNVWEWCDDGYADYEQALTPGENSSELQKFIGRVGPAVRGLKVVRGGGWNTDYHSARSASRGSNPPSRRFVALGFRFIILPMEVEEEKSDEEGEATVSTDSLFGGDDDEDSAKKDEKAEEDAGDESEDPAEENVDEKNEEDADESEEAEEDGGFSF